MDGLERLFQSQARLIMGSRWRRTLALVVLLPVWGLSFLVPRRQDVWVLGTWEGVSYSDNTRHLHAWLHANEKDRIKAIWITRNLPLARELRELGAEATTPYSARGIWACLRAGHYIYTHTVDDICVWLSGRACRTNLWHGVPLKKINYDNRFDRYRHVRGQQRLRDWSQRFKRLVAPHRILAPSKSQAQVFASAFRADESRIFIHGYPRNDRLVNSTFPDLLLPEESERLDAIRRIKSRGRKIILYMPTFRRSEQPGQYRKALRLEELDRELEALDAHMLVKAHPMSTDLNSFDEGDFEHITSIPAWMDPYLLLPLIDILLTDYSSIFYDYLLLDRPIVFYPFDIEHYQQIERELYFDYEKHVPGPIARTHDELIAHFRALNRSEDDYRARRRKLLAEVSDGDGGENCREIVASIAANKISKAHRHA